MRSFQNFLDWIEQKAQEPKHTCEAEKKSALEKLRATIQALGLIPSIPIITVTGTNGKGSTVHALGTLLIQAGYQVGTFTSPHLISPCERIAIQLEPVPEQTLLETMNTLAEKINLNTFPFFSIYFLLALKVFKSTSLDFLILEVGVGGRLDVTNILDAAMVILTEVALDHTDLLGKTREEIGHEKVGLLRQNQLFICGDPSPPKTVIQKASELHCQSFWIDQQFGFFEHEKTWDLWLLNRMFCGLPKPLMHPVSLACAVMGVRFCREPSRPFMMTSNLVLAMTSWHLPGRCQRITFKSHEIILDVAHNPAAVQYLTSYLNKLPPNENTFALFGAMRDKNIPEMIKIMVPFIRSWWLTDLPSSRAEKAEKIAHLNACDINVIETFDSPTFALEKILSAAPKHSRIVIFGSFLMVGTAIHKIT